MSESQAAICSTWTTLLTTARALSAVAEVILEVAIAQVEPEVPFCIIGLGRFGGGELSYQSDLDVIFVHADSRRTGLPESKSSHRGTKSSRGRIIRLRPPGRASSLPREFCGSSTARVPPNRSSTWTSDYALRGGKVVSRATSKDSRSISSRWAQTWERQALLRARVVAGDRSVGEQFIELAGRFVWEPPIGDEEITEIRRMKARIERERIPAGEDPQFHLKLGKGSLSDVEWTVQMLQLRAPGSRHRDLGHAVRPRT